MGRLFSFQSVVLINPRSTGGNNDANALARRCIASLPKGSSRPIRRATPALICLVDAMKPRETEGSRREPRGTLFLASDEPTPRHPIPRHAYCLPIVAPANISIIVLLSHVPRHVEAAALTFGRLLACLPKSHKRNTTLNNYYYQRSSCNNVKVH